MRERKRERERGPQQREEVGEKIWGPEKEQQTLGDKGTRSGVMPSSIYDKLDTLFAKLRVVMNMMLAEDCNFLRAALPPHRFRRR